MKHVILFTAMTLGLSCTEPSSSLESEHDLDGSSAEVREGSEPGDGGQQDEGLVEDTASTNGSQWDVEVEVELPTDTEVPVEVLPSSDVHEGDGDSASVGDAIAEPEGEPSLSCTFPAGGKGTQTVEVMWDGEEATAVLDAPAECLRTFVLQSTAPLLDDLPSNPRTIVEKEGQPILRTDNPLFDGLYALAMEEMRENRDRKSVV